MRVRPELTRSTDPILRSAQDDLTRTPYSGASTCPKASSRSAQYCFIRAAAARSASFSCWTATWLFPCPAAREAHRDRRPVRPGDPHRLPARGGPDREVHARQPSRPGARVVEGAIQPDQRHGERPALVRLERAVPALPDRAQALDALVAHRDGLRPPAGHLVLLVHVLRDLPVRPGVRLGVVERLHPAFPGAAGLSP